MPRHVRVLWWLVVVAVATAGCTPNLTFSDRVSRATMQDASSLTAPGRGPITVHWTPASFPDRVDKIGPSGEEGSGTRAYIPIGAAVASRVEELLDAAVGVENASPNVLTINVLEAESAYRYAIGMITSRHIEAASSVLDAEFSIGGSQWRERFTAQTKYRPETDGAEGTGALDRVWDDIALQVATSVMAQRWASTPADWRSQTPIASSPPSSSPRAEPVVVPRAPRPSPNAPPAATSTVPPGVAAAAAGDPRLQRLIDAWPQLSESVRNRIIGIVEGAELSREE